MFDLDNRVIIVTGGGSGIGRIYSTRLAEAGARVVVADLAQESANQTAELINGADGKAAAAWVDIADEQAVSNMVDVALAAFGRIDGLVNNAALMSSLPRRSWLEIPIKEWDQVMQVNLRGLFLCCRAVYPHMKKQGSGAIVNISSSRVFEGTPNRLHYTTSKAGVIGFTRSLAREVGGDGIRVNCIAPGLTLSDAQIASSTPEYLAQARAGQALTRRQTPEDLAGAVMYLLSDASASMTGQTLNIDGGKMMH